MNTIELKDKIIAHFKALGFDIILYFGKNTPKGKVFILVWNGGGPAPRLYSLADYYFDGAEVVEFGLYAVYIRNFLPAGHGQTGTCKKCGCTDQDACLDQETKRPCHWKKSDLCSACTE